MKYACLLGICMMIILSQFVNSFAVDITKDLQRAPSLLNGVDYSKLDFVLQNSKKHPLTSMLIVKDGYLLSENYYDNNKKETLHNVCSVSKTVIGLLIGISVKKNYINSVNDPISSYLKALPDNWDADKNKIQLNHLLSMTSGLSWNNDDYNIIYKSKNPLHYILSKPLQASPSEVFNYDVSAYILSAILNEVSGLSADSFACKHFFNLLGITNTKWETLGNYTLGYNGLSITSEEMAKIGQFMLQKGFTGTDSLLPEYWMDEMSQNQAKNGIGASIEGMGDATVGGYGFMCWLARKNSVRFFWAGGFGGQRIIVVPDKKLVVVMTASINKSFWMPQTMYWKKMIDQDRNLLNFFNNEILACFE